MRFTTKEILIFFGSLALLLTGFISRNDIINKWNTKETITYNILISLYPYLIFPSIATTSKMLHQSTEAHIAHYDKLTKSMETIANSEGSAKFMGQEYYEASFGPNPTRIAEFEWTRPPDKISNNVEEYKAEDKNKLSIVCACPYDATPQSKLPLILHYFAGGIVIGSSKSEMVLYRGLAQEVNAVVCSVGYRKVPEYPYPTPIMDALEGSLQVLHRKLPIEERLQVGIDYEKVATLGLSAGGYMSAHMARRLTVEYNKSLKCQISIVPMAKPHGGTKSMIKYWYTGVWTGPDNSYSWTMFLPDDDGTLASDWKVSLLVDPPNDDDDDDDDDDVISRLPPAYIQIATRDTLRDEGEMYAERLRAQQKLIELKEYDTSHVGLNPGLSNGGIADGAMVQTVNVLKEYLNA